MKSQAHIVLRTDPRIAHLPQGQHLIEFMVRASSDILIDAKSLADFKARIEISLYPFNKDLGALEFEVLDDVGDRADDYSDVFILSVNLTSTIH